MKVNDLRNKEVYLTVEELKIGDCFQYGKYHELYVLISDDPHMIFNLENGYLEQIEKYTEVMRVKTEINIIG